MSNEPRKPDNRTGFEPDLERLQGEWDRMEQAEPPDLLDRAVRNAARRELETKRRARPLRWLGGFATATVAVLALTLMFEQEPQVPAPALEEAEGLRLEKQSAGPKERFDAAEPVEAPLPAAEPRPMTREAQRESLPVESFSESRAKRAAAAPAEKDAGMNDVPQFELLQVMPAEEEAALSPEQWIEELRVLKNAGRQAEFEAGLEAFRNAYPEVELPADLVDSTP